MEISWWCLDSTRSYFKFESQQCPRPPAQVIGTASPFILHVVKLVLPWLTTVFVSSPEPSFFHWHHDILCDYHISTYLLSSYPVFIQVRSEIFEQNVSCTRPWGGLTSQNGMEPSEIRKWKPLTPPLSTTVLTVRTIITRTRIMASWWLFFGARLQKGLTWESNVPEVPVWLTFHSSFVQSKDPFN